MAELDRKIGPVIHRIDQIPLPAVQFYTLNNGIPVYEVSAGTQDVVKVEIIFRGGRLLEDVKLASRATCFMIKEETRLTRAAELAEKVDYYGASLGSDFNMDMITISALFLGKYQQEIFPILSEVIHQPAFSETELKKYIERNVSELNVELTKNEVIAYRDFTEKIFGANHIYGYNSTPALYRKLNPVNCEQFYNDYIGSDKCTIFLSGNITEDTRNQLNSALGKEKKDTFSKRYQPSRLPITRQEWSYKGKGNFQNSIMIGRRLFTKDHPDYPGMVVLNTILGGYFGSRLMKSIREEKGFTYSVHSLMDISKWDGCLYICTDVDPENTRSTLQEIYHQMNILQQERMLPAELEMVKNYIIGNILNMLDGPFRSAKWIKSLIMHDLTMVQGGEIIEKIREVSSLEIQRLAQIYLQKSTLSELVVY
jgi:predicted Zn-dependent peptidase